MHSNISNISKYKNSSTNIENRYFNNMERIKRKFYVIINRAEEEKIQIFIVMKSVSGNATLNY